MTKKELKKLASDICIYKTIAMNNNAYSMLAYYDFLIEQINFLLLQIDVNQFD